MPVAQGPTINARNAIIVGSVGVIVAVLLVVVVLFVAGSADDIESQLGDNDFRGIDARDIADEIGERGPVPFPDLVGGDRPLWLQHFGTDPDTRWFAFLARVPGEPDCFAEWDAQAQGFYSSCDPTVTFPPDGEGLEQLPVIIDDGSLTIDLNRLTEQEETAADG